MSERNGDVADRLRRVEGQVRGIARMVEERRDCPEIVTQLSAVHGALDEVERLLLREHLRGLLGALARPTDGAERERRIAAILSALGARTAREGAQR